MNRWKKLAAVAAVLVITTGAGAAWAQDGTDNGAGSASPPPQTRALGGVSREAVFQPITPCRLVDTRNTGGKFNVGQERVYDVRGGGASFAAQGGLAGGCGIPSSATAVEITVTAAEATGNGFVRVYPSTAPNATFLNSTAGFNASNTGTVGLCGSSGGLCLLNADLRVKDFGSPTHIIVDVQGYYHQQMAAHVLANGTLSRNSRATGVNFQGTGIYRVRFDRDVSACAYNVTVGETVSGSQDGYGTAQPESGVTTGVYVRTFNTAGAGANKPFYVTVTC